MKRTKEIKYFAIYAENYLHEFNNEPDACFASLALAKNYADSEFDSYIINECEVIFYDDGCVSVFEYTTYDSEKN